MSKTLKNRKIRVFLSKLLVTALVAGTFTVGGVSQTKAATDSGASKVQSDTPVVVAGQTTSGTAAPAAPVASAPAASNIPAQNPSVSASPSASPAAIVDSSLVSLSETSMTMMAGKKKTLSMKGTDIAPVWSSSDTNIVTVNESGKVKAKKVGEAVVSATIGNVTKTCSIKVVAKMTKNDFSKYDKANFVNYCKKKKYDSGYAWWGHTRYLSHKNRVTKRGVKLGTIQTDVQKLYGDFEPKKCTSKDPFMAMKMVKNCKVKNYADMTYEDPASSAEYRIRFYFDSKKKVAGIFLICNYSKINKKDLKKYI